ncbi:MAG: methionine synthase [Fervidicoccaceae archaeon]|nr:methionine synthase [Fervidicoccaceae archaeon]MCC6051770.1 methionine synthase [Fervidicoccaceae archaeon]
MSNEIVLPILPTSVIGSYPKPWWLRKVRRLWEMGKADDDDLMEAENDAVIAVVREQELAGIDIPSDGEQRREEMVEYFAERLGGFKFYGPVRVWGNNYFNKPAVVDKIVYKEPITLSEYLFLRKVSTRRIVKVTITGPYTIADWSFNEYYSTKEELVKELSSIINKELKMLADNGALFIQIDEPALTTHPDEVEWALELIDRTADNINAKIGLHVCYSNYRLLMPHLDNLRNISQLLLEFANRRFTDLDILKDFPFEIGLGVIDVHSKRIESPEEVSQAIKKALNYIDADRIYINPDCGLKLMPREVARLKMENMVKGTMIVREELKKRGREITIFRTRM